MNKQNCVVVERNDLSFFKKGTLGKQELRDFNKIITFAKNKKIGLPHGQSVIYGQKELEIMKKMFGWWEVLLKNEVPGYRTSEESVEITKIVLSSIVNNYPFKFIAILCPAYKKGAGEVGLKDKLGRTTKNIIVFTNKLKEQTNNLGIRCSVEFWFSDLLVENYHLLKKEDIKTSLNNNFSLIEQFVLEVDREMVCKKLSQIGSLEYSIGLSGKTESSTIPKKIIERVSIRSKFFYKEILGWPDEMVSDRLEILANAYEKIGQEFKKQEPALMVFGEKMIERGKMYSGNQKSY